MSDRWSGRLAALARALLAAIVLIVPLVFWRATLDVFNLTKLTALWVLGIVSAGLWAAASVESPRRPPVRLVVPAIAFLAAVGLAVALAPNRPVAVIGLYHRYGGFASIALYVLVALLVAALYRSDPERLSSIAHASLVAAVGVAVYVLVQEVNLDPLEWVAPAGGFPLHPGSTLGNSQFAGAFCGIAFPFVLWVRRPGLSVPLSGLVLTALWFTQSRSGMLAAVAGTLGFVAFAWPRTRRWAAGVGALAVLVVGLLFWRPSLAETAVPGDPPQVLRTASVQERQWTWRAAAGVFAERPLVGWGPDSFFERSPPHRVEEAGAALGAQIPDKPHNVYLEYAATTGVLGAGAFLVVVGVSLVGVFRASDAAPPRERLLGAAFGGSLVAYLAQATFSIDVPPLALPGWVAIGAAAALAAPREVVKGPWSSEPVRTEVADHRPRRSRLIRWTSYTLVAGLAGGSIVAGLRPLVADLHARTGHAAETSPFRLGEATSAYERAIGWHSHEAVYRALAGRTTRRQALATADPEERRAFLERSIAHHQEAVRLQPGNVLLMVNLAEAYTLWARQVDPSRYEDAERWWRRAVAHDPTDRDVLAGYARFREARAAVGEDGRKAP